MASYVGVVILAIFGFGLSQLLSTYAANDPDAVSVTASVSLCESVGDPEVGYTNDCTATWTWNGAQHHVSQNFGVSKPTTTWLWIDSRTGVFLPRQSIGAHLTAIFLFGLCSLPLLFCLWLFVLRSALDNARTRRRER